MLLKTVAHSLKILHDLRIVHSDLKPSNVLIKRTELGYTTKLIDFDSSYIAGNPPPPEEIVGTMNYYSPELVATSRAAGERRRAHRGLRHLRARPDLRRVPHRRPAALRPGAYHEAAIAVLNGQPLKLAPGRTRPAPVVELVERMLLADPGPARRSARSTPP